MKNTIAIVLDMQTGLVNEQPYMGRTVVETIQGVVAKCRQEGLEILYIRHDDGPGEELHPGNEAFEVYEKLAPMEGDILFDKHYNSGFRQTGLKEYLREKKVTHVILMGMQTEYCLDATIKAGFEHGFHIFIPENTNTTFDNEFMSAQESIAYYNHKIWNGRYATVKPFQPVELFWWHFLTETGKSLRTSYFETFHFCTEEQAANELLELVLAGKKTATTSSTLAYPEQEKRPTVGSYSIVTDFAGNPRCVIQTTAVTELPFSEMTYEICKREGEDDCLETWQKGHKRFFEAEGKEVGYEFSEDMAILFEDFEVVYRI